MIIDPGREGSLKPPVDSRAGYAPVWRYLDRNVPLGVKLAAPVLLITALAILLGAIIVTQEATRSADSGYIADASAVAHAAAHDFTTTASRQEDISSSLRDLTAYEPLILGIWIVDTSQPGSPVVASDRSQEIGRTSLLTSSELASVQAGRDYSSRETAQGKPVLETIQRIADGPYAVVVLTSLASESALVARTVLWLAGAGLLAGLLDIGGLALILEFGVLRRIRRVHRAIGSYARGRERVQLSEGEEPGGRDLLFNLAREIDHKLHDLQDRERAGDVLSDLGMASLQGAAPEDLTSRALELVRKTADLDRCFLVDSSGTEVVFTAAGGETKRATGSQLPIWLGALVRAAARARRPVLADRLGEECRFWDAHGADGPAVAAFVPLPGGPDPIGVIVALAKPGSGVNSPLVTLMEAVATTLGETLQRTAAAKAQHESEVKSKALSTVSHEMRNPLNAMLGFTRLLIDGAAGPLNDKQQEYLKRVDDASHHLLGLVNDYLDLARIMAGSMPVTIELVPVEPEVRSVLELMGPIAADRRVSLHSAIAPGLVANVDRLRLRQILMNLTSNAIKFTPARGHVRVEVAGGSNGVRISVIDTGMGIPADRQHLIFTEFAQLHKGDSANGSGLGLVLTKRFVEAMGGFIRFTSAEGAGTIFDVWLPGENSPKVALEGEASAVA